MSQIGTNKSQSAEDRSRGTRPFARRVKRITLCKNTQRRRSTSCWWESGGGDVE